MSALVVVPLAISSMSRAMVAAYVLDRITDDGWPVTTGGREEGPWIKAVAVNRALHAAPGRDDDVLIVHDADCVVDLDALRQAVAVIERDEAGWAIPYEHVVRYDEATTQAVITGHDPESVTLTRQPYIGIPGGGIVVLRRAVYRACPLDRRFVGWGDEDQSWGWALGTLFGAPWRHGAALVHLWHEPAVSASTRRAHSLDSNRLRRAYRAYRGNPDLMRMLVAEA